MRLKKTRFTKEERIQGKKNLLKLALWVSKHRVRGWHMMSSQRCALAQIPKAFPEREDAPHGYGYYDSHDGRPGAYTFFAFTSDEESKVFPDDVLFANDNTQKQQVAMMRKFARLNPGYKVT